jgi:hypothetical protein
LNRGLRLLAGALLAFAGPAAAQDEPDPFAKAAPSIARMNFSTFRTTGHCTAVQAGARAVLALGPCVRSASFADLHFLFGYDRQTWREHRVGKAAFNDPAHSQLKMICLDRDLAASAFSAGDAPARDERVIVAGYGEPAVHRLSFRGCRVADVRRPGEVVLSCAAQRGAAGAVVFTQDSRRARLVGIVAGGFGTFSVALAWTGRSAAELCPPSGKESERNG